MKDLYWELEVARRKKSCKSKEEELRTGGKDDAHGSSKETFMVGDNIFQWNVKVSSSVTQLWIRTSDTFWKILIMITFSSSWTLPWICILSFLL